jgi:NADH-quinone oxidoreductase subunit G
VGAIAAGALPLPVPGWGVEQPGRNADEILAALIPPVSDEADADEPAEPELRAVVVGAVDPADFADPGLAYAAIAAAGFVVSLEIRRSTITEHADVVLPVAPVAEKAGRFVTWEGRRRPFDSTITGTGAMSDAQVLDALADELDVTLGLRTVASARDELATFAGFGTQPRAAAPNRHKPAEPGEGEALLSTWHELLDAGRGQDGDPHLAGTAKLARAIISAATATRHGLTDTVTVSTDAGSLTVPIELGDLPDNVVWLPTNARGCAVRSTLRAVNGTTVQLSGGGS